MIDFILEQLITIGGSSTTVGILIIIGFIINLFGVDNKKKRIGFEYTEMSPYALSIIIPTDGKGFWSGIWMWLTFQDNGLSLKRFCI